MRETNILLETRLLGCTSGMANLDARLIVDGKRYPSTKIEVDYLYVHIPKSAVFLDIAMQFCEDHPKLKNINFTQSYFEHKRIK